MEYKIIAESNIDAFARSLLEAGKEGWTQMEGQQGWVTNLHTLFSVQLQREEGKTEAVAEEKPQRGRKPLAKEA